jgi:glycosyltransferase involved in cell wall biosynthesis
LALPLGLSALWTAVDKRTFPIGVDPAIGLNPVYRQRHLKYFMAAKNKVSASVPRQNTDTARVAILMCTKDGAAFLHDQLQSIANQTHTNWILFISDDGSIDDTKKILERFADRHGQKTVIRNGPGKGACANFLSLANDPTISADYFAFSDQDDVWYPNKLQRALTWLVTVPHDVPGLYCGRTELVSVDGQSCGFSPLFTRPPTFRNALIQSLGGGNTMTFNQTTKKILEAAATFDVVSHDWWVYQLVSAADGMVCYDPQPTLKYRQHSSNLIGSNRDWRARFVRIRMMLSGRFRDWNETNIAALRRLPADMMRPKNREALELFAKARSTSLLKRVYYLRQSGVYRQTFLGNLGLLAATIIKKI